MTAFAAWVQGPGGTILLVVFMLVLVVLAEAEGIRRGRAQVRRQLAERQAERRAGAWLTQMRAAEELDPARPVLYGRRRPRDAREDPDLISRILERPRRTSIAAFLDPPPIPMSIGAFIESVHEDAEPWELVLDRAVADMHAGLDAWRAEHGLSQ